MAGRLVELTGSADFKVGGSGVNGTGRAVVLEAADHQEAYDLADAYFPEDVAGVPRGSIEVKDLGDGTVFEITVEYSSQVVTQAPSAVGQPSPGGTQPANGPQPGESHQPSDPVGPEFSVSTKGGTQHVKLSRFVVESVALAGLTASDPKRRIGDSEKGTDGVDLIVPTGEITISVKVREMTLGYFLTVMDMTGKTNNAAWKGVEEGSLLFLGMDGNYRPADGWNLQYHFLYRPVEENIEVAPGLTITRKLGHELIDVRFRKVKDAGSNVIIEEPFEVHLHSVYKTADFRDLKL